MKKERGAVLIIALIFLLLITAIGAALVSSGSFQTVMVGNVQQREDVFRTAESAAEQTLANDAMAQTAANALNVVQAVPAAQMNPLPANSGKAYSATVVAINAPGRMVAGYSAGTVMYRTYEIRGSAKANDNRVQTDVVLGALRLAPALNNGD